MVRRITPSTRPIVRQITSSTRPNSRFYRESRRTPERPPCRAQPGGYRAQTDLPSATSSLEQSSSGEGMDRRELAPPGDPLPSQLGKTDEGAQRRNPETSESVRRTPSCRERVRLACLLLGVLPFSRDSHSFHISKSLLSLSPEPARNARGSSDREASGKRERGKAAPFIERPFPFMFRAQSHVHIRSTQRFTQVISRNPLSRM